MKKMPIQKAQQQSLHHKIDVNFMISHKSEIYLKDQTPCGERRLYDETFWQELKKKIEVHEIHLYKPFSTRGRFSQNLANVLYHFTNVHRFKKQAIKNAISHIFFGEESSLLRFLKIKKSVVTCLDIIPLVYPQEYSWYYRLFYRQCLLGLKKADHIVTVSEHTKKDLVKFFHLDPQKITTAYWGINSIFKPCSIPDHFFSQYALSRHKKYLLGVGGLDIPRKNMKVIIDILPRLIQEYPDVEVIIAGYKNDQSKYSIASSIPPDLQSKIHLLPKVPDQDLCYLYNLATIFIFPSLYEGFGLPPVEAMACGTPVIAANNSSLTEAVGDAGILVDGKDEEAIIHGVKQLLNNEELRKELIQKGFEHIQKFDWKKCAQQLISIYSELDQRDKK